MEAEDASGAFPFPLDLRPVLCLCGGFREA
ncbi:hypothetical protein SAMN05444745_10896 [Arthrobacter sp. OV608]|nr:hypothetical protein SAMN05444745_10896 [Arthrobacter sp. OV608]